ncbi:MAG: fibrillarin-like rRNA/tRNA 2'-O-methyltransferase [Candidatus Bathyarchaeia archaeon]
MNGAKVKAHERFSGVYWVRLREGATRLATLSIAPGKASYREKIIESGRNQYRIWNPFHSKLAAAVMRGLNLFPVRQGQKVLYLGAATGTTVSHMSDIVEASGRIFCIEFAQRTIRELMNNVSTHRPNMAPILADARFPENYRMMVEQVDGVYCDIAQPEQAKALADNSEMFLKRDGWAILVVKASSVDVTKNPKDVFDSEIKELEKRGFVTAAQTSLEPYDKAHVLAVAFYKG